MLLSFIDGVGVVAHRDRVRPFSFKASRVSAVFRAGQLDIAQRRSFLYEGIARIWTRALLQGSGRRVSRARGNDPRFDAVFVLQRFRLVDVAQQVEASGYRNRGRIRRMYARVNRDVHLVVY